MFPITAFTAANLYNVQRLLTRLVSLRVFLLVFDAFPEFNTRAATWTFPAFQLITAVWWLLSKRVLDQHLVCQTGGYTHASLLNTLLRVCS